MGVARAADFTNRTDIPPTVDANMAKVMAFEARFMVARVVTGERSVDRFTVDSPSGIDFVTEFSSLESQFDFWGNRG